MRISALGGFFVLGDSKLLTNLQRLSLTLCALPAILASNAQAGTLQPNADGTALDTATGLVWKRCMEGQTWDGTTCTGTAAKYNFDAANALTGKVTFAGQSDWRMPNIRELLTIVDDTVYNTTLDKTVFPNALASDVWSGSPVAGYASYAWHVYSGYGSSGYGNRSSNVSGVRLVRGGQSFATLNALARPDSDYTDHGDGTVTHKPTNLMWQRCMVGQSWDGKTCVGTATQMSWDNAKALTSTLAGKADWRMPTRNELSSLVDYTKTTPPTLNSSLFPNDRASNVWSGSPYAGDASYAWYISFNGGSSGYDYRSGNDGYVSYNYGVRLVRGGQSDLSDTDCFLDWAEAQLPNLLNPAHQPTQTAGPISYRAYTNTGVYFGLGGDSVFAMGGSVVGSNLQVVASLKQFLPTARAASCK